MDLVTAESPHEEIDQLATTLSILSSTNSFLLMDRSLTLRCDALRCETEFCAACDPSAYCSQDGDVTIHPQLPVVDLEQAYNGIYEKYAHIKPERTTLTKVRDLIDSIRFIDLSFSIFAVD